MLTKTRVIEFERLKNQLGRLLEEMRELSKKKADGVVNVFKVTLINEMLAVANDFLSPDLFPMKDFRSFDAAHVPSNSDVVIALTQYIGALEIFRSQNLVEMVETDYLDNETCWNVWDTAERDMRTGRPTISLLTLTREKVPKAPRPHYGDDEEADDEDDGEGTDEEDEDEEADDEDVAGEP